jgi:hypothetical protein
MTALVDLATYILSVMGLTVLVVWPEHGPTALLRDRVLKRFLPAAARGVLDCYICCGFWCALLLSPVWWRLCGGYWCWFGCLMVPAIFWMVLPGARSE